MPPMMMRKVVKETNIERTLMIRNKMKSYQFYAETQGGSDGMNKDH